MRYKILEYPLMAVVHPQLLHSALGKTNNDLMRAPDWILLKWVSTNSHPAMMVTFMPDSIQSNTLLCNKKMRIAFPGRFLIVENQKLVISLKHKFNLLKSGPYFLKIFSSLLSAFSGFGIILFHQSINVYFGRE